MHTKWLAHLLLDTISLGSANLDKTVDELRAAQHPWWINLGCNDFQREHQFRHRLNLGDALTEVGQWPCVTASWSNVRGAPRLKSAPTATLTAGTIEMSLEVRGVRRKEHNIRRPIMAGFLHPDTTSILPLDLILILTDIDYIRYEFRFAFFPDL
ncbi:unnamed protein product [Heligmosomoides polygyrus]|uniref:Secreted protein n=1 Tax=Heligmosomoides polygyrus TaxID=6339 RepID=A0A183FQA9_HELPZ|nr:unnamed protein product [Heligmosomoides polygyrus]